MPDTSQVRVIQCTDVSGLGCLESLVVAVHHVGFVDRAERHAIDTAGLFDAGFQQAGFHEGCTPCIALSKADVAQELFHLYAIIVTGLFPDANVGEVYLLQAWCVYTSALYRISPTAT